MTYDASEQSVQAGAPVEIYEFARNAKVWRFTSAAEDLVVESENYSAELLRRSAIETTTEQARNALTIETRRNFEIADLFRISPPTDVISVTVRRYHRGDGELAVIWKGRVLNAEWSGAMATLRCEPVSVSLGRIGLQRLCQTSCPHVLYGPGCLVDETLHQINTTVDAISGSVITLAALLDRPYGGGWVQKVDADGNFERRFIRSFSGLALTLSRPFADLSVSDAVTAFPGCDHTMTTCDSTYDNILNYGGTPFIPRQNPFGGDPIF